MNYHSKYPALADLKNAARSRIPHFVWEYLDSGTGLENTRKRNRQKLDEVLFSPSILHGDLSQDLSVKFLKSNFSLPFGVAPVGMSGLIWPGAEKVLSQMCKRAGIPYTLSTVATQTPEDISPYVGENGWFQLYPPRDPETLDDMLKRIQEAGFSTLILTVDVPVASRRERQTRGGLMHPPKITGKLAIQAIRKPAWLNGIRKSGIPRMKFLEAYSDVKKSLSSTEHIGYIIRTSPDINYLRRLRGKWKGNLVVKGVMRAKDTNLLEQVGVDAIWVSNHAGRQFDGTISSIEALPLIRKSTKLPIIFDSGVESGLDILRALSLGADFVMMGSSWHYALGALGSDGPNHLIEILKKDLVANMGQIGSSSFKDLPEKLLVL
ncbi:MAG: alpha-hydroxy acid oxidase [Proteobacteria bacterium]|jgi:L-lactate dehydrogenase (cytochrome)|nr:alpha-hydroxy acid oxidase [Pseudomonadota bacterium]